MHLCRNCNAPLSFTFADLGRQPPSNAFLTDPDQPETIYPLHAYVCEKCWLVQLPSTVVREAIFNDHYAYFSSNSKGFLAQCQQYAERMASPAMFPYVVEIASNDGYLLQYFAKLGIRVRGIEPSANVAEAAIAKGIPTTIDFFGAATAMHETTMRGQADLIIANNVLAHVPDVHDFVEGIRILLKKGGTASIEFPWLLNLIKGCQFDTIYHEHYSYYWLHTVMDILAQHALQISQVEKLPNLGGSLRLFITHFGDHRNRHNSVKEILTEEITFGFDRLPTYEKFSRDIFKIKHELVNALLYARQIGKTVGGYGAPAKTTVLLNYCGIGKDLLPYTVDTLPFKQGKYIPGVGVPIFPEDRLFAYMPDYVLLFPWNLKKEIDHKIGGRVRSWNGKFVTAIPSLEIF
jgi:SAM-dependent methyltransferase